MSQYQFRSLTVKLLPEAGLERQGLACPGVSLCGSPTFCINPSLCGQCSQLVSCGRCSVIVSLCDQCSRLATDCGVCSQLVSGCGACTQLASIHCTGVSCAAGSRCSTIEWTEIITTSPYELEQTVLQGLDVRQELGVLKQALQEALARTDEVEQRVMSGAKPATVEETDALRQQLLEAVAELDEHKAALEGEQK